jgi:molecular chaperone DnaK
MSEVELRGQGNMLMVNAHIIGIDLGTHNSVVAIPDPTSPGGVRVIADQYDREITPSVVWADESGAVIVGYEAKMRHDAVFAIQRLMGTNVTVRLGGVERTPEEISGMILTCLSDMAERQVGEVRRAVITVPAYFESSQELATKIAGEKFASLVVEDILQKPVAAALAYGFEDNRNHLALMCYDMDHREFDVSIVRKERGKPHVLAFDGDRHSGGDDFDKLLVEYLLDKLERPPYRYNLHLDPYNEADQAKFTALKLLAERAKINLTEDLTTSIRGREVFLDNNGRTVSFDLTVSRKEFNELIRGHIKRSIHYCHRCLEKANLTPDDLDEIILVGGSSFIPLVQEMVSHAFGKKPKLFCPETCVAIGAALKAASLGAIITQRHRDVEVALRLEPYQSPTWDTRPMIAGQIEVSGLGIDLTGATVIITRGDMGFAAHTALNLDGSFVFETVELSEGVTNHFEVEVQGRQGQALITHGFTIVHDPEAEEVVLPKTAMLAKPIAVMLPTGLELFAKEADRLSLTVEKTFHRTDRTGVFRLPIYEENRELGEIRIELPPDLPIGTPIEITLEFREDFTIVAHAYIPLINRAAQITIEIPPVPFRPWRRWPRTSRSSRGALRKPWI